MAVIGPFLMSVLGQVFAKLAPVIVQELTALFTLWLHSVVTKLQDPASTAKIMSLVNVPHPTALAYWNSKSPREKTAMVIATIILVILLIALAVHFL